VGCTVALFLHSCLLEWILSSECVLQRVSQTSSRFFEPWWLVALQLQSGSTVRTDLAYGRFLEANS